MNELGTTLLLSGAIGLALPWVGLPLWLSARRRAGARPLRTDYGHFPAVTVVLASRESAQDIQNRIAALLTDRYPQLSVIVVLDAVGAKATIEEFAGADERVTFLIGDLPGGKACALNAALRAVRTEIVVFADTRQRFSPNAVARLTAPFADASVGAVSGSYALPDADAGTPIARYWAHENWIRRTEGEIHSSVGVVGPIWAMRTALWQPLRAGLILDDVQTPMRLVRDGWRVVVAEGAHAHEPHASTPVGEWRRKVRTLTGNLQLLAWNPWLLLPWRNPIWLTYILHKLLRFLSPYAALLALVGAGLILADQLAAAFTVRELAAAGVVAVFLIVSVPPVRRRGSQLIQWIALMQAALVVGTWNGMRGRWDVWRR